jgi:hypothetical protein
MKEFDAKILCENFINFPEVFQNNISRIAAAYYTLKRKKSKFLKDFSPEEINKIEESVKFISYLEIQNAEIEFAEISKRPKEPLKLRIKKTLILLFMTLLFLWLLIFNNFIGCNGVRYDGH